MNTPRSYFAFALKSIAADLDIQFGETYSLRHPQVVQALAAELLSLLGVQAALAPAPLPERIHPVVRRASTSSTVSVPVSYVSAGVK